MTDIERLLDDHKQFVKDIIDKGNSSKDAFDLIMRYFATEEKEFGGETELENRDAAKMIYNALGWKSKWYDVINSFWNVFSWAAHKALPDKYPIKEAGNVGIYKNSYKTYKSFPKKYRDDDGTIRDDTEKILGEFPRLKELARLTHCAANFMPCPGSLYNGTKGVLDDVCDYFPLMIDKIQFCADNNEPIKYKVKDKEKIIDVETVKEWHKWFLINRENYCLEDYYNIDGKTIEGIPLFTGQSLNNPVPKSEEEKEVGECIDNMVERTERRGKRMAAKLAEKLSK